MKDNPICSVLPHGFQRHPREQPASAVPGISLDGNWCFTSVEQDKPTPSPNFLTGGFYNLSVLVDE